VIVVDTSVWSRAFRRSPKAPPRNPTSAATVLEELIHQHQPVALPGIVLQELLSGVRSERQFNQLRADLALFPVLLADEDDHLRAAHIMNSCRQSGQPVASIDALIAATTIGASGELLTCDTDFQRIATCTSLRVRLLPAQ
jgi:predicted nucleic acid-binding protein